MIKDVPIESDNIKLDQFLKFSDVVSSGGEAKYLITNDQVKVNGVIENKRGYKLSMGDTVEILNMGIFKVVPKEE